MAYYSVELSDIEKMCGVTLEKVADTLPKVFVQGDRVHLPANTPPALCGAVARAAIGGPVKFVGTGKHTGYPIYELAQTDN